MYFRAGVSKWMEGKGLEKPQSYISRVITMNNFNNVLHMFRESKQGKGRSKNQERKGDVNRLILIFVVKEIQQNCRGFVCLLVFFLLCFHQAGKSADCCPWLQVPATLFSYAVVLPVFLGYHM